MYVAGGLAECGSFNRYFRVRISSYDLEQGGLGGDSFIHAHIDSRVCHDIAELLRYRSPRGISEGEYSAEELFDSLSVVGNSDLEGGLRAVVADRSCYYRLADGILGRLKDSKTGVLSGKGHGQLFVGVNAEFIERGIIAELKLFYNYIGVVDTCGFFYGERNIAGVVLDIDVILMLAVRGDDRLVVAVEYDGFVCFGAVYHLIGVYSLYKRQIVSGSDGDSDLIIRYVVVAEYDAGRLGLGIIERYVLRLDSE